eukprot:1222415-Pleurochrysis_carterae.AAC.1
MVDTFMPDGVPSSVRPSHAPATNELPRLVDAAVAAKADSPPPDLLKQCQSLVGALLYCSTQPRPDVAYAVGMLCRAMSCPTLALLKAAHHVLAYLYHHQHVELRYELCFRALRGHSDSDWAARHSTTGWVFTHGLAAISWSSKTQASVALSSCEAEIVAAFEAAKEAV